MNLRMECIELGDRDPGSLVLAFDEKDIAYRTSSLFQFEVDLSTAHKTVRSTTNPSSSKRRPTRC